MIKNPINYLIIEGPDLSGKTTLYNQIHKKTGYRWNIQDRSALSMLVHAKLYNRDQFSHIESLNYEINNLNNHILILLPSWKVILKRFNDRGDEIQNLYSLKKIYNLFEKASEEFENHPNVTIVRAEIDDFILKDIIDGLLMFEHANTYELSKRIKQLTADSKNYEKIGINFTHYDDCTFQDINFNDLLYEKEKKYYETIKKEINKKITNESLGKNEYGRKEKINSRRFIYTSNTCISLVHFIIRDSILDCKFFLRSSNTKDILHFDLNFLKSLTKKVYENIQKLYKIDLNFCRMKVIINSAHIPSNIEQVKEEEIESKD